MPKPALGRGLGDLLKGTRVVAKPPAAPVEKPENDTPITPGLGRLLEGQPPQALKPWQHPSQPPLPAPTPSLPATARVQLSRTSLLLLAADGMLVAWCARLAYANRGNFGWLDATLSVAGMILAATLGALATRAESNQ